MGFCFSYLNFYIGLFSAVLGATLTGGLASKPHPLRGLALLVGPALIVLLAYIGYSTVRVFYRRFIEAWITSLNLEEMLGLKPTPRYEAGIKTPPFGSRWGGGFITEFERPPVRDILERARAEVWPAERLLEEVVATGDTLKYAKVIFASYAIAALLVAAFVMASWWA